MTNDDKGPRVPRKKTSQDVYDSVPTLLSLVFFFSAYSLDPSINFPKFLLHFYTKSRSTEFSVCQVMYVRFNAPQWAIYFECLAVCTTIGSGYT